METALILTKQVIIMFAMMGIGFYGYKAKWISNQGTKDMGRLLLNVAIPVIVINNFCIEKTPEKVRDLIFSAAITVIAMAVSIIVASILFHKEDRIGEFSAAFSNAGFIGLPLVQAAFGSGATFYISIMIAMVSLLQWTYGVYIITDDRSVMDVRKVIRNPLVISVIIGILLFSLEIKLPSVVTGIFSTLSGINTPLAMISSGVYLAQSDLLELLKDKEVYKVSLTRLIIIPLILMGVMKLIPFGSQQLKLAILIAASSPVGSNVSLFAQQYDKDYRKAVEDVCVSTLLCIVTVPLIIFIASAII